MDVREERLCLGGQGPVTGDEDDGDSMVACQVRVDPGLTDFRAVHSHRRDGPTVCVIEDCTRRAGPRVISDEKRSVRGRVERLHHREAARRSPEERRRLVQLFRNQVVEVPVGICDQDVRGARLDASLDRGVCLLGHQVSALLVRFAAFDRIRLYLADDAADSLHVD